jgi:hypothetical protein
VLPSAYALFAGAIAYQLLPTDYTRRARNPAPKGLRRLAALGINWMFVTAHSGLGKTGIVKKQPPASLSRAGGQLET